MRQGASPVPLISNLIPVALAHFRFLKPVILLLDITPVLEDAVLCGAAPRASPKRTKPRR